MNVRLATEKEKKRWDWFVAEALGGSFLQSWAWGEMQQHLGVQTWRFAFEEDDHWQGVALVLKRLLPLGRSWLYVPWGPAFAESAAGKPVWESLQKKLVEIAEQENAIFVRVDPATQTPPPPPWQKAEREVQPRHTLVVDLSKSEEDLLGDMHQKTRYNIRLAQKKGVQVRFSREAADVEHFLRLTKDVSERTQFSFHPDQYYRAMMQTGLAELALAEYGGAVLAAHVIVSFGNSATYAHGASSSTSRELMAPQLLQWETMKRAKAAGKRFYDFFGVAPEGADESHAWSGITRFKLGFGGRRVNYIGAYDLVLHGNMYHLFNTARRFKALLR